MICATLLMVQANLTTFNGSTMAQTLRSKTVMFVLMTQTILLFTPQDMLIHSLPHLDSPIVSSPTYDQTSISTVSKTTIWTAYNTALTTLKNTDSTKFT